MEAKLKEKVTLRTSSLDEWKQNVNTEKSTKNQIEWETVDLREAHLNFIFIFLSIEYFPNNTAAVNWATWSINFWNSFSIIFYLIQETRNKNEENQKKMALPVWKTWLI